MVSIIIKLSMSCNTDYNYKLIRKIRINSVDEKIGNELPSDYIFLIFLIL
jgi:hypothetical protein